MPASSQKLNLFGKKVFISPVLAISVGVVTLAAWYFVAQSLAAPSYTVRFVLFCVSKCSSTTSTIDKQAKEVQAYYKKQLGKSFTLEKTTSYIGKKPIKEYLCYKTPSCNNPLNSVDWYLENNPDINVSGKKTVVMLDFFAGGGKCGYGGQNFATVNKGGSSTCPISTGVAAHELGHMFGLGHTTDLTNIMYYKCVNSKGLACNLNSSQKSTVLKSPWFGATSTGGGTTACPTGGDKSGNHPVIKSGSSNTNCVKHIQYMLAKIYAWRVAAKTNLGELVPQSVNGSYGGITTGNVKKYQKYKGLSQTGYVDTATWNALHGSCVYINTHPKGGVKC